MNPFEEGKKKKLDPICRKYQQGLVEYIYPALEGEWTLHELKPGGPTTGPPHYFCRSPIGYQYYNHEGTVYPDQVHEAMNS